VLRSLVVNADDLGLTVGVNNGIFDAHDRGILTSASLFANATATVDAIRRIRSRPSLGVGVHLTLVDGAPTLPPSRVATLIQDDGRFRGSWKPFIVACLRGCVALNQVERELTAQIDRIRSEGIRLTHLDAHKHVHAFPRVLAPLLRAARQCGVGCIRNPFEPWWSLRATRPAGTLRRMQVHVMRTQGRAFTRLIREYGMITADGSMGLLATGVLDDSVLRSLIEAMPAGTWELVCHPGYRDLALDEERSGLRASREVERSALLAVIPEAIRNDSGLELIDFHQLGE